MHAAKAAEGTPWLCALPQGALLTQLALLHLPFFNLQMGGMAAKGTWVGGRAASSEGSQCQHHALRDAVLADDAFCCVSCQTALTVCSMAFLRMT